MFYASTKTVIVLVISIVCNPSIYELQHHWANWLQAAKSIYWRWSLVSFPFIVPQEAFLSKILSLAMHLFLVGGQQSSI